MFPVLAPLSCLMFNLCPFFLLLLMSLNRIAYRRVICVYQYQVADDLSGRSSSFKPHFIFCTKHCCQGLCDLMHFSLRTAHWAWCAQYLPAILTFTQSSNSKHQAAASGLAGCQLVSCVDLRGGNCTFTSIHYTYALISNSTYFELLSVECSSIGSLCFFFFHHVCSDFVPLHH